MRARRRDTEVRVGVCGNIGNVGGSGGSSEMCSCDDSDSDKDVGERGDMSMSVSALSNEEEGIIGTQG